MRNNIGVLARLSGLCVAVAAAGVLAAGVASAAVVTLNIDTDNDDKGDSLVQVDARVGLGVLSPCQVLGLGVPDLELSTSAAADLLGVADLGVEGTVVGCA
ncbi:hypothetical protein [Nocardia brasiliensis]|uniref:hypothetical protein n=1 Tax=Nocardia brasiliensis TaxID=37326 RepID=UPI0024574F82|nr:hypothetical protein [Nocardia brasiliensis]